MSGPIPAPASIATADGHRIVVTGTPAADDVMTADGPNAAHWAMPAPPGQPIDGIAGLVAERDGVDLTKFAPWVRDADAIYRDHAWCQPNGLDITQVYVNTGIFSADFYLQLEWAADPGRVTIALGGGNWYDTSIIRQPLDMGAGVWVCEERANFGPRVIGGGAIDVIAGVSWSNPLVELSANAIAFLKITKWLSDEIGGGA